MSAHLSNFNVKTYITFWLLNIEDYGWDNVIQSKKLFKQMLFEKCGSCENGDKIQTSGLNFIKHLKV